MDRADIVELRLQGVDENVARHFKEHEEELARLAVRVGRMEIYTEETQRLQQRVYALEEEKRDMLSNARGAIGI